MCKTGWEKFCLALWRAKRRKGFEGADHVFKVTYEILSVVKRGS